MTSPKQACVARAINGIAILQKISPPQVSMNDLFIIHLSTNIRHRPQNLIQAHFFIIFLSLSKKYRKFYLFPQILTIFALQLGPWMVATIPRIIGNTVRIRNNACCCEFQFRRGIFHLLHSLPLAFKLGRRNRGSKSEDLPFALEIHNLAGLRG